MNKIKKIFVIFFVLVVFLPILLMPIQKLFLINIDVELNGYTDSVDKQDLTFESFVSGEYQSAASKCLDAQMPMHGVFTKTYNTVRYNLFKEANSLVGKDYFIFGNEKYIFTELNIGSDKDFSSEENLQKIDEFVGHLSSAQEKLKKVGKDLYIYIIPSKAHVFPENMPAKYYLLANKDKPYIGDVFRNRIESTDIKTLFCEDFIDEMEYATYYPSGTHWSRTFEQSASQRVVKDLAEVTGKSYRNIAFNGVEESNTPFWRDADVWDLANIWNRIDGTFYQYNVVPAEYDCYDKMRILIYGDSFVHGLRKDILEMFPEDEIYYINYDNYIMDSDENLTVLDHDWSNLDFQYYLDNTDAVVVEMVDSMIPDFTCGFVNALDAALDDYVPNKVYPSCIDCSSSEEPDMSDTFGVHGNEGDFFWTQKEFSVTVQSPSISEKGLLIKYGISGQIINMMGEDTVAIYVNGVKVAENTYTEPENYEIYLSPEMLNINDENIYTVFGRCSRSFIPKEIGHNEDTRELALQLNYIGEAE